MLFATDTFMIKERFTISFEIIAIECSYDKNIVKQRVEDGTLHESQARRLLKSHMEKYATLSYLMTNCDLSKCREVHLLHMSDENIDKESTVKEFKDALMIKVVTV